MPPTANSGGPYSGTTGTAINFSGSGSDIDSNVTLSYLWNFGDGTTSTAQNPSHAYTAAGSYNVTVKVTGSDGESTTATTTATVSSPLTASAGATESGKEGTAVQFAGSTSGGIGSLSYLWNFGDGSTATGTLTPSHTYSTAGTYTVTLTVTDSANDSFKSTTTATIADVPPTANPGGPYSAASGTAINFSGSGSDPDPKDTLSYSWNFGDGSTSTVQDPSHAYAAAGTYTVTFTVTASDGAQTTATTTAAVTSTSSGATPSEPLLFSQNLQYVGAFRIPNYWNSIDGPSYGGTALAYDPTNNGLFLVGLNQTIEEVSIPQSIVNSSNLNNLATATILQPWTPVLPNLPTDPLTSTYVGGVDIGGLMVQNGQLYGSVYGSYDNSGSPGVFFSLSSTNLSSTTAQSWTLGRDGTANGWLLPVPSEWQSVLGASVLAGQGDISIISRTSSGPAAYGLNLTQGSSSALTSYLNYPVNAPLGPYEGPADPLESGTAHIGGAVFVPGTSSVLFIGDTGTNYNGYGEASDYGDNMATSKGSHSLNGQNTFQVWAYNANDFYAAKEGQIQPWQVQPYDVWDFTVPIPGKYEVGGAAFDSSTGRLYVSVLNADTQVQYSSLPLIEVFQMTMTPSGSSGPAAPQVGTLAATTTQAAPSGSTSPLMPGPIPSGTPVVLTSGNVYPVDLGVSTVNPNLTITEVAFYLETNSSGVPNPSTDELLGYGTPSTIANASHNWTLTMSTTGLTAGTYTIYAMAKDSNGSWSAPTTTTLTISYYLGM